MVGACVQAGSRCRLQEQMIRLVATMLLLLLLVVVVILLLRLLLLLLQMIRLVATMISYCRIIVARMLSDKKKRHLPFKESIQNLFRDTSTNATNV